jgi:hypothetical protein
MAIAAMISWVLTASIGAYMLRTWVMRGGLRRQRATRVGVPPAVVFGHASAALAGLLLWLGFVATDTAAAPEATPPAAPGTVTDEMIASLLADPFPAPGRPRLKMAGLVPVAHGFAALTTFMLAVLAAISAR